MLSMLNVTNQTEADMNTKHTCNESQRAFGRKVAGCPRCEELRNGAPARGGWQKSYFSMKKQREEMESRAIKSHFAPGGPHSLGLCGPVCTAFDW